MKSKQKLWVMLFTLLMVLFSSAAFASGITHGRISDCPVLSEVVKEYEECWTCTVFMMFFDASNAFAGHVATVIEGPAIQLLGAMLLVWLSFNVAVFFNSVGDTPDLGEFATKVGGMMFRAAFAVAFLTGGSEIAFGYFIEPVLTDSANLANSLVTAATKPGGDQLITAVSPKKAALSDGARTAMNGMIGGLGDGLREAQAMAQSLRCGAGYWYETPWPLDWVVEYIPNPLMWLLGCVLGAFFWVISLIFPMVLMDAIFRIGLMVGMAPVFVVAWVFPATRNYAKVAFDIILHACILFVVMALVMNMCMGMIMISMSHMGSEFISFMQEGAYVDAYESVSGGAEAGKIFVLLAVCFYGVLMPPKAEEIATQIAGGKFPPSVGMEALGMMVNLVIDLILLLITIFTLGCGALLYFARVAQLMAKSQKAVKRLQKIMKMTQKAKKRAQQMQKMARMSKIGGGNNFASHILG